MARCTLFGVAYPAFESFKAVEEFANLKDSAAGPICQLII